MTDVLVKYPTRGRPGLFFLTLGQYLADPTVRVLVTIDVDDAKMNNAPVLERLAATERVVYRVGESRGKIQAINDGVAESSWDVLILGSDDMVPQRRDYASRFVKLLLSWFPDGDGVLHTNDGRVGQKLNTQVVMGRKYFDRFGYVYHPDYTALWCDNEFQAVSESLGCAAWVDEVVLKHDWVDATGRDALHERNESYYDADGEIFRRRQSAGFPSLV